MNRDNLRNEVISIIRDRRCAYTSELYESTKSSWADLIDTLMALEREGYVVRDGEPLDLTKPIATTRWCLSHGGEGGTNEFGFVEGLVVSGAVLKDLGAPLRYGIGLSEALSQIICGAKRSLKIMMPYISDFFSAIISNCLGDLARLPLIRVMTESNAQNRRVLGQISGYLPHLEVRYATKKNEDGTKIRGVHAKLVIIDDERALLATFNFTSTHLLVNYDVGVLISGNVVKILSEMFDALWKRLEIREQVRN